MADEFQYWRDALAGKDVPIHADAPHSGYYRMREGKAGPWLPVAIWTSGGTLVCRVAQTARDPASVWTFCAANPVTKDAAKHAFETGVWPGDAPQAGHNSGTLSLAEQIRDYAGMALGWLRKGGIKDAVSKDKAANFRAKLLELGKSADAERDAKKLPFDEAARAVQAEYKPMIDEAKAAAEELRAALTAYMREEERQERERREAEFRKQQEAAAAERARIEAERAEKMARDPIAAMTDPEPELPVAPSEPKPVKVRAGGQRGRATGLRTVTTYIVTDYAAALAHVQNHPDVVAAVEKVVRAQAKAGAVVPGVESRSERVAA